MSRYERIYEERANEYDALVRAEDCDGNLRAKLREITQRLPTRDALELGFGTGRLTRWLFEEGFRVRGVERAGAMVEVAKARLAAEGYEVSGLVEGDAFGADFGSDWAAIAVAGWVFGHAVTWHPSDWQTRVHGALDAMSAAVCAGGAVVIIETLGTGHSEPAPAPSLVPYFELLEARGFSRDALRTDYRFASVDAAEGAMRFFFGDEKGARVRAEGWSTVPECTGVWSMINT